MPIPPENCVFFPCHTLEDFPTHLRDESAEGILAAWTAPWHPAVVAVTGVIPTWHRADTPPVELKQRLLLVPTASESRLPTDLNGRMADAVDCHLISVTTRAKATKEILKYLEGNSHPASDRNDLFSTDDKDVAGISVADFHALGYLALQVQVMTRRLRYSSNLDQVTFSEHVVAAAKAFLSGSESAQSSLQAAYDLLAEERDHYFSADPHLVDLVLVAPTTLGQPLLDSLLDDAPVNLLMSAETAELIGREHPRIAEIIRQRTANGTLSIVGGYPDETARLDYLGSAAVANWIQQSVERTEAAIGVRPTVFGRLGGGIPGDLAPWLVHAGFRGAVTNDFYSAVGWQDEPKMLWQSGGAEIEALTAKPLDVLQPQTFLGIGPKLGEIADAGQVSAALLVRWPGTDSVFMGDLRQASKRTLALGHFWTLERFFTHGERPYHSCSLPSVHANGVGLDAAVNDAAVNDAAVNDDGADPLSSVSRQFLMNAQREAAAFCHALAGTINPELATTTPITSTAETQSDAPEGDRPRDAGRGVRNHVALQPQLMLAARALVSALGQSPAATESPSATYAVINPHCGAVRSDVILNGKPPSATTPGLFGSSVSKRRTKVTLDVPGNGFSTIASDPSGSAKSSSSKGLFGLFKKEKVLAQNNTLANEFLDVAIHPETGAIAAVHAGQQRGNRFSWQLAYFNAGGPDNGYSRMRAKSIRVLEADVANGTIEAQGELLVGDEIVGRFVNRYSVRRGSRWLEVDTELTSLDPEFSTQPWKNYVAGRATWATEALSIRPLVRDKRHRTSGKRIEAPLGVLVDEGDRKLLVCGYGLPAHRRIGSKELDTLLVVRGESGRRFRLAYGFDVPTPVRAAKQQLVSPIAIPLDQLNGQPTRGWLIDVDARSIVISDTRLIDRNTLELVVVETSGKPTRGKISLFRDVVAAKRCGSSQPDDNADQIPIENAAAVLRLGGHEVVTVQIKLNAE